MWCCLFADPAFKTVSTADLLQNFKQMGEFAKAHRKKHKIWPHPAQTYVAVKKLQKQKKKEERAAARVKKNIIRMKLQGKKKEEHAAARVEKNIIRMML